LAGTGTARRSSLTKLSPNIQLVVDVVVVVVTTGRIVACCWSPAQNVEQEKKHGTQHTGRDNNWNAVAQSRRELHYDRFVWTKSEMKKCLNEAGGGGE
jgi:hypothetical protein